MRYAVIDLGTNTFNLLIVEPLPNRTFKTLYNEKMESKLGRGGIHKSIIVEEAFDRGLSCLKKQKEIILSYNCDKIFAFGTSALRNASNGDEFIAIVKNDLNIDIQLISGNEEAELIYLGNKHAIDFDGNALIMDIGGGSNEFIIATNKEILWKQSVEVGMQRLINKFHPTDPIIHSDIQKIESFLYQELSDLTAALKTFPTTTLIGSSGVFDTIRAMIDIKKNTNTSKPSCEISHEDFLYLHNQYTVCTQEEIKKMEGMDVMRYEMMPIASVFVNFLINTYSLKQIFQSSYSLKEGVAYKFLLK